MRRHLFSALSVACLLLLSITPSLAAQDATPSSQASPFASLGLPELNVTITQNGFEGIPESLTAGRYLVTATAAEGVDPARAVGFVQPRGMSVDDFLEALMGGAPDMGSPDASATEGGDGGDTMMLPPFVYDAVMAGGASAGTSTVLDLTPGEWFAWGDDPSLPVEPVTFEVTGDMPADLVTPESTATISLGEYVIEVTAGELAAGPQVVQIDNIGAQPHFIDLVKAPDGYTVEQAQAAFEGEMSGTPVADMGRAQDIATTQTQTNGTSIWTSWDLEPGVYLMMCYFPDMGDGAPHAMHGMYTAFEVAG